MKNSMIIHEKKQLVKEAIIKAVPGILDLKLGCEVITNEEPWIFCMVVTPPEGKDIRLAYQYDENGIYADCHFSKNKIVEIIGRPITLADVLIAIVEKYSISERDFYILELIENHGKCWDLSQDFDHQSEETYNFLWSLLCE